jgi:hypothetical protein
LNAAKGLYTLRFKKNTKLGESIPLGKAWPETKIKILDQVVNEENEKMGE